MNSKVIDLNETKRSGRTALRATGTFFKGVGQTVVRGTVRSGKAVGGYVKRHENGISHIAGLTVAVFLIGIAAAAAQRVLPYQEEQKANA